MSKMSCFRCGYWTWQDNRKSGFCSWYRDEKEGETWEGTCFRLKSALSETLKFDDPKTGLNWELTELGKKKAEAVYKYCDSQNKCSPNCLLDKICTCSKTKRNFEDWPAHDIAAAYELIKDKQPAETPVTMPGTATSATHYQLFLEQPIELMQKLMSPEEFRGFLLGNVIKYSLRFGHKDDIKSEAGKIAQYGKWLQQAVNGETIKP